MDQPMTRPDGNYEIPSVSQQDIFAVLFVAGETCIADICRCLEICHDTAVSALESLDNFLREQTPLMLSITCDKVKLTTRPEFASVVLRLDSAHQRQPRRLSDGALETLSIIAYRQPVTKEEIDRIRKVDSEKTLITLQQAGLVTAMSSAGRAHLYRTTQRFLELAAIKNISELPPLSSMVTELSRQTIIVESVLQEPEEKATEAAHTRYTDQSINCSG